MIPIDRDLDEEITTIELRIRHRTLRVIAKGLAGPARRCNAASHRPQFCSWPQGPALR